MTRLAAWQVPLRSAMTVLVCAGSAFALAPAAARTPVVAFSQDTADNEWRVAQARQMAEAFADEANVKYVVSRGGGSTAKQIADIEAFTEQRVDLLIVSPRDAQLLAAPVARAYRAGIPVMLITRRVDGEAYTTHVGPDDEAIARAAAEAIAVRLGGRGGVVMLKGTPTTSTAMQRTRGFLAGLRNHPELKLVAAPVANYQRSDAIREMEAVLKTGMPFAAVFAQNDTMLSGARLALKMAGRDPGRLVTVGIDYLPEARAAIVAGEQTASFIYPTCVPQILSTARAILRGETVPRRISVPATLVDRGNVERFPTPF